MAAPVHEVNDVRWYERLMGFTDSDRPAARVSARAEAVTEELERTIQRLRDLIAEKDGNGGQAP